MTRSEYQQIQWNKYHRINENNNIERQCTLCEDWLEENVDNFYMLNKSYPEKGYMGRCKKCAGKSAREWNITHVDKCRESYKKNHKNPDRKAIEKERNLLRKEKGYFSDYQKKHPDKMIEYTKNHRHHDITETEWQGCLEVFDCKCAYCGISEKEHKEKFGERLHKDHVDHEGYNDVRNAVPGCKQCNSYKWQHDMEEWYRKQKFFSEEKLQMIKWWITEGYKNCIETKPPYIIKKEKNKNNNKFHWNLWSIDDKRNMINIISTRNRKKDLDDDIKKYLKELDE